MIGAERTATLIHTHHTSHTHTHTHQPKYPHKMKIFGFYMAIDVRERTTVLYSKSIKNKHSFQPPPTLLCSGRLPHSRPINDKFSNRNNINIDMETMETMARRDDGGEDVDDNQQQQQQKSDKSLCMTWHILGQLILLFPTHTHHFYDCVVWVWTHSVISNEATEREQSKPKKKQK